MSRRSARSSSWMKRPICLKAGDYGAWGSAAPLDPQSYSSELVHVGTGDVELVEDELDEVEETDELEEVEELSEPRSPPPIPSEAPQIIEAARTLLDPCDEPAAQPIPWHDPKSWAGLERSELC